MATKKPRDYEAIASVPVYKDSSSSDSGSVSDDDELAYLSATNTHRHASKRRLNLLGVWLFASFIISAYTYLISIVTSDWSRRARTHGAGVVETPLRPWVKYQPEIFPERHWSDQYPLVGQPSDALDARWSEIMDNFYTEVPYDYMKKMGRLNEGIQLDNGNFVATYSVIHTLHCVKRLHQSYFPDRYFPNMTKEEDELQLEHNLHCLQMIIDTIMCNADIVPITAVWMDNQPLPSGNRHVEHECVDWSLMTEGLRQKRIDAFEPGVFVHPLYGPVVPDGKATVLKDRTGYGHLGRVLKVGKDGEWSA